MNHKNRISTDFKPQSKIKSNKIHNYNLPHGFIKIGKNRFLGLDLAGSDGCDLVVGAAFLLSRLVGKAFWKFSTALRSQTFTGSCSLLFFVFRNFLVFTTINRAALVFVKCTIPMVKISVVGFTLFVNISSKLSITFAERSFAISRGVLADEVLVPCIRINHGIHFVWLPPWADISTEVIHCTSNAFLVPFAGRVDLVDGVSVAGEYVVGPVDHAVAAVGAVAAPFTVLRVVQVEDHLLHRLVLTQLHLRDRVVRGADFGA